MTERSAIRREAGESPLFSLVLPAYNPGEELHRTWNQLMTFLHEQRRRWEIIFVCDGCRDGSDRLLVEWARSCPHQVRVLQSPTNRGKGHAVRRGLLRARGDYRIFTDVDLSYPLDMIDGMAAQLAQGNDVVIASRALPASEEIHREGLKPYLWGRKFKSRIFSWAARALLRIGAHDPQAGLKGFSALAVRTLFPYVKCHGFGFDCEVLVACRYFGIPVREMPVRVVYHSSASTTRLTTLGGMFGELMTIRKRWRGIARQGLGRSIFVTVGRMQEARRYWSRRERRISRLIAAKG